MVAAVDGIATAHLLLSAVPELSYSPMVLFLNRLRTLSVCQSCKCSQFDLDWAADMMADSKYWVVPMDFRPLTRVCMKSSETGTSAISIAALDIAVTNTVTG